MAVAGGLPTELEDTTNNMDICVVESSGVHSGQLLMFELVSRKVLAGTFPAPREVFVHNVSDEFQEEKPAHVFPAGLEVFLRIFN